MALDGTRVRVALTGNVWFVPVSDTTNYGTDPTDLETPDGAINLGYTTPEGVVFTFGREVEGLDAWQTSDVIRNLVTNEPRSMAFTLRQLERDTWLATMGGTVTSLGVDLFRWEPVTAEIPTGALYVDLEDGELQYRVGFRRAENTAETQFSFVRNNAVNLPNEWSAVAPGGGKKSVFLDTNDPAFGN
jgi:hypothetical protein